MKKIMLPLMALLLLGGGGAGAYFYFGKSAEASVAEAPADEAKKAEEAEAEGEAKKITYVEMPAIILPIIDREGISQTVSMVISLQVNDETKVEKVKEKLPVLADAYLSDMYGTLSQKSAMDGGVIKVSTLKARLTDITKKVMGEGMADEVLLQVLQQHRT